MLPNHPLRIPIIINIPTLPLTETMIEAQLKASDQKVLKKIGPYFHACLRVHDALNSHEFGYFFRWPVNPYEMGLENYWQMVRRPMDLATIEHKLRQGLYCKLADFDADVRLMIQNACLYNANSQEVLSSIYQFSDYYESQYQQLRHLFETEVQIDYRKHRKAPPRKDDFKYKLNEFKKSFFTNDRMMELSKRLRVIGEKNLKELEAALKKKFPDYDITQENIALQDMPVEQLMYLLELARKYKPYYYECQPQVVRLFKANFHKKMAEKAARKAAQQQESSFEVDDEL